MAWPILKTSIKLTAGVGAIYFTYEYGAWGSKDDSVKMYEKIQNIMPGTTQYRAGIPSTSELCHRTKTSWNSGVHYTCESLACLPNTVKTNGKELVDKAIDALNNPNEK